VDFLWLIFVVFIVNRLFRSAVWFLATFGLPPAPVPPTGWTPVGSMGQFAQNRAIRQNNISVFINYKSDEIRQLV
jgi:hypothetical protein